MAHKRGLHVHVADGNEIEIYKDIDDCEFWVNLKLSKDGTVLVLGFCYSRIDDYPANIPNNDKAIRNFIKEITQFNNKN